MDGAGPLDFQSSLEGRWTVEPILTSLLRRESNYGTNTTSGLTIQTECPV